ncbi:MAG: S8 family peptidase, partial [Flavobacteriales bacterium]
HGFAQSAVVPGKVIAKINTENSDKLATQLEAFEIFGSLNILSVKPKYPYSVEPSSDETDIHGNAFIDLTRTYVIEVSESDNLDNVIQTLKNSAVFEWVETTTYSESFYTPTDPNIGTLDHLAHANLYDAWDTTQGDTNVVIGITDTSFDLLHEDLQGNTKHNYADPINGDDDDMDGFTDNFSGWDIWGNDNGVFSNNDWHGTGVLAVAAATTDNGVGMSGVGFKCKYLPVKIANDATNGNTIIVTSDGHDAIVYCADKGVKVINCSWGTLTNSNDGQDAVNYATVNKNAVVVAASGNTDAEEFRYPASFHHAISVTGVHNSDEFNNGSNPSFTRSDSVDISAQGYNVMATATVGSSGGTEVYQTTGGTSIAAPIVSGVVALIRSEFPCLTSIETMERLLDNAVDIEDVGTNFTYAGKIGKRVDAAAALQGNPCDPIGVDESNNLVSLDIYPNPAFDEVNIRLSKTSKWAIEILDTKGRLILSQTINGDRLTLSNLATGLYLARVSNDDSVATKPFSIIEQ